MELRPREVDLLDAYLAPYLTLAGDRRTAGLLGATVRGIIAEKGFSSARDVGLLMKELMARHRGRADGKRAQEIARKLLP